MNRDAMSYVLTAHWPILSSAEKMDAIRALEIVDQQSGVELVRVLPSVIRLEPNPTPPSAPALALSPNGDDE